MFGKLCRVVGQFNRDPGPKPSISDATLWKSSIQSYVFSQASSSRRRDFWSKGPRGHSSLTIHIFVSKGPSLFQLHIVKIRCCGTVRAHPSQPHDGFTSWSGRDFHSCRRCGKRHHVHVGAITRPVRASSTSCRTPQATDEAEPSAAGCACFRRPGSQAKRRCRRTSVILTNES